MEKLSFLSATWEKYLAHNLQGCELPRSIWQFAEQFVPARNYPIKYFILPLLSCVSYIIGFSVEFEDIDSTGLRALLWTVAVGRSGSGKSLGINVHLKAFGKQENQKANVSAYFGEPVHTNSYIP
jgi:hypothetical protein